MATTPLWGTREWLRQQRSRPMAVLPSHSAGCWICRFAFPMGGMMSKCAPMRTPRTIAARRTDGWCARQDHGRLAVRPSGCRVPSERALSTFAWSADPMTAPERPLPRTVTLSARLMAMTYPEPNSGCWLCVASDSGNGYSKISVRGRLQYAHRVSWELHRGPIPSGMMIDHVCRTRCCVNPDHLRVVTPRQNATENNVGPAASRAARTHCPTCGGSYYAATGQRRCRACQRRSGMLRQQRYRTRQREAS